MFQTHLAPDLRKMLICFRNPIETSACDPSRVSRIKQMKQKERHQKYVCTQFYILDLLLLPIPCNTLSVFVSLKTVVCLSAAYAACIEKSRVQFDPLILYSAVTRELEHKKGETFLRRKPSPAMDTDTNTLYCCISLYFYA